MTARRTVRTVATVVNPVVVHGTVRSRDRAASVAGYAVQVELTRVLDAGEGQLTMPSSTSARLTESGEFRIPLTGIGQPRAPVTVAVSAPQGVEVFRQDHTIEQLAKPLRIAVRTIPLIEVSPTDDPTLGARARINGQVIDDRGRPVPAGLAVVLWGVGRTDGDGPPAERPLVVTQTQVGGWLAAPWVSDQVARAYGRVAGDAPVPIALDADRRLPRTVRLTIDLDTIETSEPGCECPGEAVPPQAPDPADLAANPDAFAQDLGGTCVDLTTPNRAIEEFSYFMAVRTSQPRVRGLAIDPRETVPPALMADLLGVSIASQALGFTRSTPVAFQSASLTLDVQAARSLVRTDTPPTVAEIAQASWLSEVSHTTSLIDAGLQIAPGRGPLDADHPIDWDYTPTIYLALDIAHGHLLQYKEVWRSAGFSLGKLLHSLPLAPGQRRQMALIDWDRRTRSAREESLEFEEQLDALLDHDRDVLELVGSRLDEEVAGGSRNTTWGAAGGVGAGFIGSGFGIFGGVAGGASGSSSSAWQDSARAFAADSMQQLRDRISQRSSSMRSQRSSVVQSVGQGEGFRAQTEVVANYNRCHSMTVEYFEVLRHFIVTHELAGARECVFVPFPITVFDRAKALRWRETLARRLRNDRLREGFDAIERIADDWVGWDFPEAAYCEEAPESIEGELRISFLLPRPRDAADGAFQIDTWAPLAPFLDIDSLELFTAKLNSLTARNRDRVFREEIAPGIAATLVQRLRLAFVTADGGETEVSIDATLVSRYAEGQPLYITVNPAGAVPPVPRQDVTHVKLWYDGEPLPPDSRVIVHSGRLRYRTPHLTAMLLRADRILDDIKEGDAVVVATPLSQRELRNPRDEDIELADRLVAHLNDHLEHYHQVIWMTLDPQRRFMLLDAVLVPGMGGRSIASVCANELVGIVGNSLVLPLAPGQRLDPTLAAADDDAPSSSLLDAYATPPMPPIRISVPTRGVHAEAVMGACEACETIDDTRYWRWTTDGQLELPQILPIGTESRAATEPNLTPTPLPAPLVQIQNAPAVPDPTGLAPAFGLLSTPDLFRDVTGLQGTQANAQAAFQASLSAASALGDQAARLATQQELGRNGGLMLDRIEQAKNDGLITPSVAQELANSALAGLSGAPGSSAAPPVTDPIVDSVLDQAAQSPEAHIVTTTPEETVDVSFTDEQPVLPSDLFASAPIERTDMVRADVLNGAVDTYETLALYWGDDLALAEAQGLVARDPADAGRFLVQRRLRIVHPSEPNAPGVVAGTGRLPVVVLVHGDHPGWSTEGSIANLDGYAYLQDELARHGIVSVSVDTNAVTALGPLIDMRADMIEGSFDTLAALDGDPTSALHGRLNLEQVGLLGHGSAGTAVMVAAQNNARRLAEERIGIEAVCLLGTTDFRYLAMSGAHTSFLGVIQGGLDGDVTGAGEAGGPVGTGFRVYDVAECDKAMVFIERAGHNRFNSVWATAGEDPRLDPADLDRLVPEADHQALASEYIGGLFRWRLLGDSEPQGLFDGTRTNSRGAEVSLQWEFGSVREVLDEMDPHYPARGVRTLHGSSIGQMDLLTLDGRPLANETGHRASVLVIEPTASPEPVYTLDGIRGVANSFISWTDYDVFTFRVGAEYDLTDAATIAADALPAFSLKFTSFEDSVVIRSTELESSLVPRRPVFHSVIHHDGTIENCSLLRLETMAMPISRLASLSNVIDTVSIIPSATFARRVFITSLQLVRY
jgi:hypothetical protein